MYSRLYLHIPFCLRKCGYCAFASRENADRDQRARYSEILLQEMVLRRAAHPPSVPLASVYFGGGTPSLLEQPQVASLLQRAGDLFGLAADCEITLEANPGTVDHGRLAGYRAAGVNRLSFGVQSFDDGMLRAIGRIHSAAQAFRAIDDARRAGFDNLSLDLMHGLPGQTAQAWRRQLETAAALGVEHLSVYGLTIEEGTPFASRYVEGGGLPDEDAAAAMFELADGYLTAQGYEHYEIANYARPGRRSRHNCGYWQRDGYLGLGAAAHSFLRDGHGLRFHNPVGEDAYAAAVASGEAAQCGLERLSHRDAMAEFMFLGLRMSEGISCVQFRTEFGVTVEHVYSAVLDRLAGMGLLIRDGERIRLAGNGMLLSNRVFSEFLV